MKVRRRSRSSAWPLILCAGVSGLFGFLLRAAFEPSRPSSEAPVVTLLACPAPTPAAPAPAPPARQVSTKPSTKPGAPLPELAKVDEPREALLAFVRERSAELASCAGERRERLRLTVRLDVSAEGRVESVSVQETEASLASVRTCVERGMKSWSLPAEWLSGERTLLVSVVL